MKTRRKTPKGQFRILMEGLMRDGWKPHPTMAAFVKDGEIIYADDLAKGIVDPKPIVEVKSG